MMSDAGEIRWKQRLSNLTKAMAQLDAACEQEDYTDLERAGLIKTFEMSIELAWKTLKDLLAYEGYEDKTPRDVLRRSFEAGYLREEAAQSALEALLRRNVLRHVYNETAAREAVELIKRSYLPMLRDLAETLTKKRGTT